MKFIDSHAHLTESCYSDAEIEAMLERAQKNGVETIVVICTDVPTLKKGLEVKQRYPNQLFLVAATTPHDAEREGLENFSIMEAAARSGQLVAVGESGLDYHYAHSSKEVQKALLIRYLHLALELKLPIVIHCREAFADFFELIDREYRRGQDYGAGVLHCFTGSVEEAKGVLNRGWYISLSGIVTFKKSDSLREVARIVPLDRLLIETDAPFLAPQSKRGQPNEPSYLPEVAATIAAVKQISIEEVAFATTANAKRLFNLPF